VLELKLTPTQPTLTLELSPTDTSLERGVALSFKTSFGPEDSGLVLTLAPFFKGEPGVGIAGGVEGDVFVKQSAADNDGNWEKLSDLAKERLKLTDLKDVSGTPTAGQLFVWDTVTQKFVPEARQATLVSGTNIKTVSGFDLLGSGDIRTWTDFVTQWSVAPTLVETQTGGQVWRYTKGSQVVYRFVPNPYTATEDKIYASFTTPTLSGLITSRG